MFLVTGGTGFIGSNLVARLSDQGERVIVSDWLGRGDKWRNLAKHQLEDIIAPERLPQFLEKYGHNLDAVFHMGAISATTETDGDTLLDNNFRLSCALWDFCYRQSKPFIYASSAATYGGGEHGFNDDADIAKLAPLNGYGWSKQLFDRWVLARNQGPKRWAGLKFFNVYGPNEYHKGAQASVALHLFDQIQAGEPAKLFQSHNPDYPNGGQLRDFIHVDDGVDVMLWLYATKNLTSGLYNVGTGSARSFHDLARAVFAGMGQSEQIAFIPTPENIRAHYQYFTEADVRKLRAAGYDKPFRTLEDGVQDYVGNFLMKGKAHR